MFDFRRTHTCGELTKSDIEKKVTLSGWVNKRRDFGKIIFIDLRDKYGMTQLVIDCNNQNELTQKALSIRSEYVISIIGTVIAREDKLINKKMKTGAIEIKVDDLEILSKAKTPPFAIFDDKSEVNEELRLKYRYLDIRRGNVLEKLHIRHKTVLAIRNILSDDGFTEIETPLLSKTTPEGARDYLVPSRIFPGNFYALPQSPQLFKQILMISSLDKYFQIAKCFRDEDLRADRQPEFTQVDMEMSFNTPEELFSLMENLMKKIFKDIVNVDIETPFIQIPYSECMEKYGTDRPDLRFGMELIRLDDIFKKSSCDFIKNEKCIKSITVKEGASLSRKELDEFTKTIKKFKAASLVAMKMKDGEISSSINKFLSEENLEEIKSITKLENNDLILICAGDDAHVNQAMDHIRRQIARKNGLIKNDVYKFLWVTEFPMFSFDEEENRLQSEHHPFTSPKFEDINILEEKPLEAKALAYDLVLNGYEIAGGSQRIHSSDLQEKIFKLLNLSDEDIKIKFGFFLEALQYGTPPHLGIAIGLDRLIMILSQTENIKDVIAFPKTQKASDLMSQAPSIADEKQLSELKIKTEHEEINWN